MLKIKPIQFRIIGNIFIIEAENCVSSFRVDLESMMFFMKFFQSFAVQSCSLPHIKFKSKSCENHHYYIYIYIYIYYNVEFLEMCIYFFF
jgi:hypothetical protein